MKVIAKKNRELALINAQNTQNENRAETITLVVPEEYEDYNKKIVFILPNNTRVSDIITNNEYQITNAITQYEEVEFYIWLTKGNVDFRTKTKPLKFYHNENASNDITPEQIGLVNTVVNLLEEEIDKVENLDLDVEKIGTVATLTLTKKDGTTKEVEITDGQDGYTPQKGTDYFTQEDIEEIENGVKTDLEETVLVDYSLITETGSKIDLSINTTNYKLTAILKDKNNNTIYTSNEIDLPLETMVVSASYNNTTKEIILTLQNGTTVEFSIADLVSGLVSESQLQTILANYYTQTEINNLLANKVDKVAGKGLSTNDFTDEYKEKVDTNTEDIEDIQEEQTEQNTEIGNLQAENERLRNTLPTTTGTGQDVTLNKTAELEFVKPPLPMGNSEQVQYSGKNLIPMINQEVTISGITFKAINGRLIINGTATNDITGNSFINNNFMFHLNVGNYVLSRTNVNSNLTINLMASDTQLISRLVRSDTNLTASFNVTVEKDVYIGFYIPQNSSFSNYECGVMVSTDGGTYEPYVGGTASPNPDYPQEITNVTGDVEVVVENKNLFDISKVTWGKYNVYNNQSGNYTNAFIAYINVQKNKQISISTKYEVAARTSYQFLDKNNNVINGVYQSINKKEYAWTNITVPENATQLLISQLDCPQANNIEIQVEYNTTPITYVAHKEQTFTFPLGNEKLMLGDYLADDGIHHVRGQDIFDGSEDEVWEKIYGSIENGIALYSVNKNHKQIDGLSDKFIMRNSLSIWYNGEGVTTKWRADKIGFMIDAERINNDYSISAIRSLMNNNPVTVEYELEQEVIVPYTSAQQEVYNQIKQALSYEGQTNISSNQNAIFNVEAYQSTKLILESIDSRLTLVEG